MVAHRCWLFDADEVRVEPSVPSVRPVSVNRKVYGKRSTPSSRPSGYRLVRAQHVRDLESSWRYFGSPIKEHDLNACGFICAVSCFSSTMCRCFMSAAAGQQHGVLHSICRCYALKTLSGCQLQRRSHPSASQWSAEW